MKTLTRRQKEVYDFIKAYTKKNGYPPTIREISRHFKFSSPAGALVHVEALQKKGYIERDHASRGIRLTAEPPLEISVVKVIGSFSKSGEIKTKPEEEFIPLPDEKSDLVGILSETDVPDAGILRGDYVIFERGAKREGLVWANTKKGAYVGFLKKDEFKVLCSTFDDYNENFKLLGAFYGVLRIPKKEGRK